MSKFEHDPELSARMFQHRLTGTLVGARRWPQPLHSGLPPHKGIVLPANDKRVWAWTLAFSGVAPEALSQTKIDKHVRDWQLRNERLGRPIRLPVLGSFCDQ